MNTTAVSLTLATMLAIVPASNARATTSGNATLEWQQLTFSITDTNLLDGVTPSLVWTTQHVQTSVYTSNSATNERSYPTVSAADFATPLALSADVSNAHGSSALDASTLSAWAKTENGYGGGGGTANVTSLSYGEGFFTLTGEGIARISLPYSMSVVGQAGDSSNYTAAQIYLSGQTDLNYVGSPSLNTYDAGDAATHGVLGFEVQNLAGTPVHTVQVNAFAEVRSTSVISAVPEPERYAMLLIGLSMLGAVSRRRPH